MERFFRLAITGLALCTALAPCAAAPRRAKAVKPASRVHWVQAAQRSGLISRSALTTVPEGIAALQSAPKAILVSKSQKTLTLLENGQVLRTYPIAIGFVVTGTKQKAGDWRTPEGLYYVGAHHPGSRFYLALKVSYPNVDDAERGLRAGLINQRQYQAIRNANASGQMPPQDTRLGYNIEIHGGYQLDPTAPASQPRVNGYTMGCMGLTNAMVREVYHWAPQGTPILIQP